VVEGHSLDDVYSDVLTAILGGISRSLEFGVPLWSLKSLNASQCLAPTSWSPSV
jgi:hypothetical protein